jgi:pimeloyl-ACP methyl ester carboxylesterase
MRTLPLRIRIPQLWLPLLLLANTLTFGQDASKPSAASQKPADQSAADKMTRKDVQEIIANNRKIVTSNGIEKLVAVRINGIDQWLSIRGRDSRNPILLFLHGGPGSPTMPVDYTFQSPWEDYFTVVQWDQRGTGKTYASDPKGQAPLTIEQMTSDAEQVVEYLQKTYGKKKIFLLGHSWGSALGVALAQRHPEWFYAYIGVGQMINTQKSEAGGYEFALSEAKSHHNVEAVKELEAIAPYPGAQGTLTVDRVGTQRKWLMYYGGLTWGRTDFMWDANAWQLSPDYTDKDLDAIGDGSLYTLTHLLAPLQRLNYEDVTDFRCPVFLFEGRHDYDVSHTLAAQWFQRIHAPQKKLVWFEDAAHMVMEEEPGRFLFHLLTDVRPIAVKAGDAAPDEAVE